MLRKHGIRVKLQAQPFQVLAALLERPGTIVTREELRKHLWPDDTFVDFEHGLNAAVTRLRQALGESAERPRYIETLAKRGYRFTAKVEGQTIEVEQEIPSIPVTAPKRRAGLWIAAAVLVAATGAGAFFLVSDRAAPAVGRLVPLTSFRGREIYPALSPDGNRVAFSWNGEKQDNFDIYVLPVPSGTPVRLTTDLADDISPAWSPDGRTLAFLRRLGGDRGQLVLVAATGGPEHILREVLDSELLTSPGRLVSLAWSPDGRWIAASHRESERLGEGIYLFSLTGESRQLTSAPDYGDHMPAFSPDGRSLAFCRLPGFSTSEIYLLPLDGGAARPLTTYKRWSVNPVWTRDGRGILHIFGDRPRGQRLLRIIDVSDTKASWRGIPSSEDASEISAGRHLVYSRQIDDDNIWRAKLPAAGDSPSAAELFISSTRGDYIPKYSPDGKRVAFVSSRTGPPEIWTSRADGSNPVQMTFFGGPLVGVLNWSPDGQWIVFHARPEGQADVFVIPAAGGSPKRLTSHVADDTWPNFSRDGRWIYFGSARSGKFRIWKMPAAGGEAVPVMGAVGNGAIESVDGQMLYYRSGSDAQAMSIWRVPVEGGQPVRVAGPAHDWPFGFAVTPDGVYYPAPPHSGELRFIRFLSFASGQTTPVAVASRPFVLEMSVSPDSKYILFDQLDEIRSDLMLVENFRP
ncbi:MAG: winged helix-turn-helix domain-containing protein [Bryobacteraceae bacterium]